MDWEVVESHIALYADYVVTHVRWEANKKARAMESWDPMARALMELAADGYFFSSRLLR